VGNAQSIFYARAEGQMVFYARAQRGSETFIIYFHARGAEAEPVENNLGGCDISSK
jgi:hypothetical protein